MSQLGAYCALGLLWLLHWLPSPALARFGRGLGCFLFVLGRSRRAVALKNLSLCFPELTLSEQRQIARRHFQAFSQVILEQGVLWWASDERYLSLVKINGLEHWEAVQDRPVIWLAPHFVGLDWGGLRLAKLKVTASVYSRQRSELLNQMLLKGRSRFNQPVLFSRQEGLRGIIRALRQGTPFFYLPDLDYGSRDAVFVPFFGVPAATITGLSRIAKITGAVVLPAIALQLPRGAGYEMKIYPAWENFPTDDVVTDTKRMNEYIEARVREMPEQYLWTHKRFKTRPAGEPRIY
ncbi:MAG: lipid A biosynthesis acyltransferase [Burkholderiales bacterium]